MARVIAVIVTEAKGEHSHNHHGSAGQEQAWEEEVWAVVWDETWEEEAQAMVSVAIAIPRFRTNGDADRPRFSDREPLPLPSRPPYTAHLGNLTYEVTQSDVEGFFKDCQVTNVRIVEDKVDQRPKGFGYVEFATLEGLKQALTLTETNFMGRNVKISIAEPRKSCALLQCSHVTYC